MTYTVQDDGRDKGKQFKITELDAFSGDKFASKAFAAAIRAGMQVPAGMEDTGMLALAKAGYAILVAMPFEFSESLLDELMTCVEFISSKGITRKIESVDIEEIQTIMKLRKAAYDLHVDFFPNGSQSISESGQSGRESKKPFLNIKTRL